MRYTKEHIRGYSQDENQKQQGLNFFVKPNTEVKPIVIENDFWEEVAIGSKTIDEDNSFLKKLIEGKKVSTWILLNFIPRYAFLYKGNPDAKAKQYLKHTLRSEKEREIVNFEMKHLNITKEQIKEYTQICKSLRKRWPGITMVELQKKLGFYLEIGVKDLPFLKSIERPLEKFPAKKPAEQIEPTKKPFVRRKKRRRNVPKLISWEDKKWKNEQKIQRKKQRRFGKIKKKFEKISDFSAVAVCLVLCSDAMFRWWDANLN